MTRYTSGLSCGGVMQITKWSKNVNGYRNNNRKSFYSNVSSDHSLSHKSTTMILSKAVDYQTDLLTREHTNFQWTGTTKRRNNEKSRRGNYWLSVHFSQTLTNLLLCLSKRLRALFSVKNLGKISESKGYKV